MLGWFGFTLGGVLGAYLLLRFLMFGYRKLNQEANDSLEIVWLSILTLAVVTVVGGYGMKNGAPEPVFDQALATYFGPVMAATVIELVRLHRRTVRRFEGQQLSGSESPALTEHKEKRNVTARPPLTIDRPA